MVQNLKDIDLDQRIEDKDEYERRILAAQMRLLLIQRWMFENRREAVLVFEGWDAAGKGGSIRRVIERLDPRGYVVHPIGAPKPDEKAVHYLQRFWQRMPQAGSIAIFDRSWYGRVMVERVEGFCTRDAWKRAYEEINSFERMLTDDGVPVVKLFLHISKKEQLKRFKSRKDDPFKNWKITDEDWRNRAKWGKYEDAVNEMLLRTSTRSAPWYGIASEHKWFGRVQVAETVVTHLADVFDIDLTLPKGWRMSGD